MSLRSFSRVALAGLLASVPSSPVAAAAPEFEVVHAFPQPSYYALGTVTSRLVLARDGNFYGVANSGGLKSAGGVFRVTPAGEMTTLHEFPFSPTPETGGLVLGRDGNLYGVISNGGATAQGCIYRITPAGEYTEILTFDGSNGARPRLWLTLCGDDSLYGTTSEGGSNGKGTAFSVSPTGAYRLLASFGPEQGGIPVGGLSRAGDDYFYGVAMQDGVYRMFRMGNGGSITPLSALTGSNLPLGPMVTAADGKLYGTTLNGGAFQNGSVFRMESDGSLTTLYSFNPAGGQSENQPSQELMVGQDGALYGAATNGGRFNGGDFFRLTLSGEFSSIGTFYMGHPVAGLAQGPDGALYGATLKDGAQQKGTLVRFSPAGVQSVLVDPGKPSAAFVPNSLVQTTDGTLYGTSLSGGGNGSGTFFRITPGDHFTQVADLPATAASPDSLLQGKDGNFYFASQFGGLLNQGPGSLGAVVKITPDGVVSTVANMSTATGINPRSLFQTSDGNFYGATSRGPFDAAMNLFRADPAGQVTDLYNVVTSFYPMTGIRLIRTKDDSLLGVALPVDPVTQGALITGRATPSSFQDVAQVNNPTGGYITAPDLLMEARDGNLYASRQVAGGAQIFRITRKGVCTALAKFDNTQSANPNTLAQGPDGNFYGTTTGVERFTSVPGPVDTPGTLFMMSPAGVVTTLLTLDQEHGSFPLSLTVGADGNLYGSTQKGGIPADGKPGGGGVVFRLRFGPAPVTLPAAVQASTTATVAGTIDPRGKATTATLQYGTDPTLKLSASVSLGSVAASAADPVTVQKALTKLKPLTHYYYRVTAKNADNPQVQNGEILSFFTGDPFSAWLTDHSLASGSGDDDGDGLSNLLEYSQDTDPHSAAATGAAVAEYGILRSHGGPSLLPSGDGLAVAYTARRDRAASGLTYTVQFSSDLSHWTDSTEMPAVIASDETMEMLTVPMTASAAGQPQFFRVQVTLP